MVFGDCLTSVLFDTSFGQLYVGTESGDIRQFNLKEPPKNLTHHVDDKSSLVFAGHTGRIVSLALNTTETVLASGSLDCFVYTWDVKKRQILKKIKHPSPVTNARFVIRYKNFFAEAIKPHVIVKGLERSLDLAKDLVLSQLQTDDLEIEEDEFDLSEEQSNKDILEENVRLRAVNKQLFDTAVTLSKKMYQKLKL